MSTLSFVELLNQEVHETTTQRATKIFKRFLASNPDMTLLDMKQALSAENMDEVFASIRLADLVRVQKFREKVNKSQREVLADQLFEALVKHPKGKEGLTRAEIKHGFEDNERMLSNLNDVIALLRRQSRVTTDGKRKALKVSIAEGSKPARKTKIQSH